MSEPRAIKIAVTALGGQGGGVLADWIVELGEENGFIAQSTSVPGVAQRTGATVYYVELFPLAAAQRAGKTPVLALMPTPGDVDIVIAAEMMEAGRAIMRGFVSGETTLIASSHRDYAIAEKIAPGDGRREVSNVESTARKSAKRFISADMAQAATETGSVISAVLFGALAGSGALPIAVERFEDAIRRSDRAVESNLRGFRQGVGVARAVATEAPRTQGAKAPEEAVPAWLLDFPAAARFYLQEGANRCLDYLDARYAELYRERMTAVFARDRDAGGRNFDFRLTETVAKHLAIAMTYEDAVRVADLKTRSSRFQRFRDDVRAGDGQIVNVTEYMHPRLEEALDLAPPGLARRIENSAFLSRAMKNLLGEGRRISTTKLRGFLQLYALGGLRGLRRASRRYHLERERIESWLALIAAHAPFDYAFACEIASLRRLIKGYGETHERGLLKYGLIVGEIDRIRASAAPARALATLRETALKDEEGAALRAAINALRPAKDAAAMLEKA